MLPRRKLDIFVHQGGSSLRPLHLLTGSDVPPAQGDVGHGPGRRHIQKSWQGSQQVPDPHHRHLPWWARHRRPRHDLRPLQLGGHDVDRHPDGVHDGRRQCACPPLPAWQGWREPADEQRHWPALPGSVAQPGRSSLPCTLLLFDPLLSHCQREYRVIIKDCRL